MTRTRIAAFAALLFLGSSRPARAAMGGDASAAPAGPAPAPGAEEIPGIDLAGLSADEIRRVKELLVLERCPCGCGMDLLECRFKDRSCPVSPELGGRIVSGVKAGWSEARIRDSLRTEEREVRLDLDGLPRRGPAGAAVTVVVFCDYQDPDCALLDGLLTGLLAAFPEDLRVVYKQFPQPNHPQAAFAAEAALAAHAQGRFAALHDEMTRGYRTLSPDSIREWAKAAGIDLAAFDAALAGPAPRAAVARDVEEARRIGLDGVPALYVNGRRYTGPLDPDSLRPVIHSARAAAPAARAR